MPRKQAKFVKPTNVSTWWLAPHCGPATLDHSEICGFCGETYLDCALANSKSIAENHEEICGGSGFWCAGCKRFWAQDACGESGWEMHQAADGARLTVQAGHAHCVCGRKLMPVLPEPTDHD
jgi:hypothetical protein